MPFLKNMKVVSKAISSNICKEKIDFEIITDWYSQILKVWGLLISP